MRDYQKVDQPYPSINYKKFLKKTEKQQFTERHIIDIIRKPKSFYSTPGCILE